MQKGLREHATSTKAELTMLLLRVAQQVLTTAVLVRSDQILGAQRSKFSTYTTCAPHASKHRLTSEWSCVCLSVRPSVVGGAPPRWLRPSLKVTSSLKLLPTPQP